MKSIHGLIFSYQKENALRELGEVRAPASVPFGGRYRAVDFALSNMVNAGVSDVGVVLHGRYQSILDHLGTGKDWDLSRKRGGMKVLPLFDYQQQHDVNAFRGKMEALIRVRSYLKGIRQKYVVMMDGDLIANLPVREIVDAHITSGADITCVCGNDSFETANGTYFDLDNDGKVNEVWYNLNRPKGYRGLEVYVVATDLLRSLVDECASHDLTNWRRDVLDAQCKTLNIHGYIWKGFASQVSTVQNYYDCSMQLLEKPIRTDVFCKKRPIRAKGADKSSAYIGADAQCINSLVPDGCYVEGVVENSILFPGVVVEAGAQVRNCILFKGSVVRKNAKLSHVIGDKYVEISEGCTMMGSANYPIVIAKEAKV